MLLWDDLIARSVITCPEGGWKPTAIAAAIESILAHAQRPVGREVIGRSFEGRPIELLTVGDGAQRAMMWSQMHGDEPTHTSVLLNLLRLMTSANGPAEPIRRGLTLGMIVPLNPDGAQRNTRHNAQGIDINRDALDFATSEGRAFRKALETFKPDYGFNLHNQRHRLAIAEPRGPASVSLLVPPLDVDDTQSDTVQVANRVAATFCQRVRQNCGGRVSRYGADFMARCFGEWVQRQGVPVILVEAGGWPENDFKALEEVHFAALAQTLDTIAATAMGKVGGLGDSDPQSYLALPRSSEYELFNVLISGAGIAQLPANATEPVIAPAALGINFPKFKAGVSIHDGVIAGIGDLHENGGITTLATKAIALPGRIVLAEPSADAFDESPADWEALAAVGATTVLIPLNLADDDLEDQIATANHDPPPLNAAMVVQWEGAEPDAATLLERLAIALGAGVVATLGELPDALVQACCRIGLPALDVETTPKRSSPIPPTIGDWLAETERLAKTLNWRERGRIALNTPADFVLAAPQGDAIAHDCLQAVYVGGTVVSETGRLNHDSPGQWIRFGR